MATLTYADVCKGNVEPEMPIEIEVEPAHFVPLFEIPLQSGIETCSVVDVDSDLIFAASLPPLGDKMCDLFLVLRPEDVPKLLFVTLGVVDMYHNTVMVRWMPEDLIPIAECVYKFNSSFLQKLPIPLFSLLCVNVYFDNHCDAPDEDSVHIIHRQQFEMSSNNFLDSLHDGVFSIGRTNGFVWLNANDATSFDAWTRTNTGECLLPGGEIFQACRKSNSNDNCVFDEREIVNALLSRGQQLDDALLSYLNLFD